MGDRKTGNVEFFIILLLYAVSVRFYYYRVDSFLKDAVIASLYFLVPAGVGLFVFSLFGTHRKLFDMLGGLKMIMLAAFLGFSLITLAYTEFNFRGMLAAYFNAAYFEFYILSIVGFYRTREVFADAGVRNGIGSVLVAAPALALAYYFHYMYFSPFPLRDIFMETHFMKGALEFSKFGILNIATGDSYMPILQVSSGVLNRFFAFDLINAQWILPAYLCVFMSLCYYCFLSSFIGDRAVLIVSLVFAAGLLGTGFSMSNNTFITGLALVFFSMLVSLNKGNRNNASLMTAELVVLIALSFIFYKFRRTPSYEGTILPYILVCIAFILAAASLNATQVLRSSVIILVLLIAPPYHRAASGYMPLMAVMYGVYFFSSQVQMNGGLAAKKLIFRKVVIYSVAAPIIGIGLGIALASINPAVSAHLGGMLDSVSVAIVGERISENEGLVAVTAEWLRHVPFAVHGLFVFVALLLFLKRRGERVVKFIDANINVLLFATVSFLAVMLLYFSPLPRVHRLVPFPSLLIFVLTAELLRCYYESYSYGDISRNRMLLVPLAIIAYAFVSRALYLIPIEDGDTSAYVKALSPFAEILIVFMAGALIALIMVRKKTVAFALVLCIVFSGLMLDKFNVMTKLYINPYGNEMPESGVISHYTLVELGTAERVGKMLKAPEVILFSDPSTLGIFEASTGYNGIFTFSNLGQFTRPEYIRDLKAILRNSFPPLEDATHSQAATDLGQYGGRSRNPMLMLAEFVDVHRGASPEAEYALQSRLSVPFQVSSIQSREEWADKYRDRIVWILTEKTVRWAYGEVGYFPMDKRFSRQYIEKYILPYFYVLVNSDNSVLVLMSK